MWRRTIILPLILLVVFLSACGDDSSSPVAEEEQLFVSITADPEVIAAGETVAITVIAENRTASTVEFGIGSSSCQLMGLIRVEGEDSGMPGSRVCLADMSPWKLAPGERREESWDWNGNVVLDGASQPLSPGVYEIVGVAGRFIGSPISVEITD